MLLRTVVLLIVLNKSCTAHFIITLKFMLFIVRFYLK